MSANDKFGLGYGDHRYDGILSYENEVLQSVFMNKESELEKQPLYDRFVTAGGMHAVPPPMTGNYMPFGPDIEIDYSQFTYGPKQTQPSESESQTSEFDTCESNSSTEPSELVSELVVNESNLESQPKVWSDAPIIEEYESDSEDEETVKNKFTHSQKPKANKKELGYGFTARACFVCGSLNHLIRDCDFHEKRMARQAELNKGLKRISDQREIRLIWNNVQRVNRQNQFVPTAVLTRTGKILVNTAKASGTKIVSTARHSFNRQAVLTSTAMKVNTIKPIVNRVRPANVFHKTHSPSSRPFKKTTVLSTNFSKQKVNTAKINAVSAVEEKRETVVKPSAGCNWRPQRYNWHNRLKFVRKLSEVYNRALKNKGIVDSGCFRHMTGNKAYLAEFQDFNGGLVAFGGSKGYITGKEFKNKDVIEFYGSKGIRREYSNARTPQQNGVAERKNMTLIEAARTMLTDSFLPNTFWAKAVSTACYVLNWVLVTKPHNKTPYELLTGKQPIISYIRPFGCHVAILNTIDHLGKFAGKSDEGFLVGYSLQSKAFRVYNLETKRVEENQANKHAGQQEANHNAGTEDTIDAGDSEKEDESAKTIFEALGRSFAQETENLIIKKEGWGEGGFARLAYYTFSTVSTPAKASNGIFTNASYDDEDAVADFINLETIVNVSPIPTSRINFIHPSTLILGDPKSAEELLQFKIQKVWILVDLPYKKIVIGTKWVYRNKKDERGVVVRNKARLVSQGQRQEERIDYDEVFAPVARIEAIRIFLAFAS
ncbi:ribonuclease H-like domain-containing protein [Tanacetum coccineum]|uniref:Ribonuclease H-like domain-containing protein n=1 Tax=Tanacetum coccineum TaxID=301880 RepID=A0ABQ5AZA0_9ASTR